MSNDSTRRFLFDNTDIRGELVRLEKSSGEIRSLHDYPPAVADLLGEFLAASVLLSTGIKFEGRLVLQAQSEGDVPLIMAECTHDQTIRGIARFTASEMSGSFSKLLRKGTLAITIEPTKGNSYQGIVPLSGESLAGCLEDYFLQSEQLATRVFLAVGKGRAAGMLLQQLPPHVTNEPEKREEDWGRVTQLAHTLTADELLNLDCETLLYRLYHQEEVRLFEPKPVAYRCSCSRERTGSALKSLGKAEIEEILAEQGEIAMTCSFCNQGYRFTQEEAIACLSEKPDLSDRPDLPDASGKQ